MADRRGASCQGLGLRSAPPPASTGELPDTPAPRTGHSDRYALGDLLQDLESLQKEFAGFHLDLKQQSIEVLTEPIILDGLDLGSFRIVLRWQEIGLPLPYEVIAQSPVTPSQDDDVTHPHVREGQLCEGEGAAAIRSALAQGRLLDFFVLVRQVLETYNPASAYVSIDRWQGIGCRGCGDRMTSDDFSSCERCGDPLCSDCISACPDCDRYICTASSASCAACDGQFCRGCLESLPSSGQQLCPSCLEEAHKESTSNDDDDDQEPADAAGPLEPAGKAAPPAPLHPPCVGQAAVFA
jgi:hypothetical protein